MDNNIVSVGMPTYNNARTVTRAMESVFAQSHTKWRLYVSDDHSTDDTRQHVSELARQRPDQVILMHPEERQYYMNFRRLLEAAETRYFVWLAGDDWWEPDFLKRSLGALEAHPEAVAAMARCRFHTGEGASHIDPGANALEGDACSRVATYLLRPDQTRMYGLYRRDALVQSFPPKVVHAYDWYLCAGTLRLGSHVSVDEVLLNRERTPSDDYLDTVERDEPSRILRFFPALRMTVLGLRNGVFPVRMKVIFALFHLNLLKNLEQVRKRLPRIAWLLSPLYFLLLRLAKMLARL